MNEQTGERLERWLAETGRRSASEEFERQVLQDPELAEDVFSALTLDEALHEAAAVNQVRVLRPKRWVWATGLAAAALAFVILMPRFMDPGADLSPRLRSGSDAGSAVGTAPKGTLDHFPNRFHWRSDDPNQETRYRWELYDSQARQRGIAVVSDTLLVRKTGLTPADSLGTWLWLVVELKKDGHEGPTSAAVEFTVMAKEQ